MNRQIRVKSHIRPYDKSIFLKTFKTENSYIRNLLSEIGSGNTIINFPCHSETELVSSRLPYLVKVNINSYSSYKYIDVEFDPVLPLEWCEERAENLSLEYLDTQPSFHGAQFLLEDLIKEGREKLQLLGWKGLGKTFCSLKAAYNLGNSGYLPLILGFYGSSGVYCVDPKKYLKKSEKNYGVALKMAERNEFTNVIEKLKESAKDMNPVVFLDDIHYMFEAAEEKRIDINEVCKILEKVNDLPEKISKVLISDVPLCYYDEKFNSKRLHSLLYSFGELNYDEQKNAVLSRNFDILCESAMKRLWVEKFDREKIYSFSRIFGIDFYYEPLQIANLLINGIPRKLVKMVKEIPEYLKMKDKKRMIYVSNEDFVSFIKLKLKTKNMKLPSDVEKILTNPNSSDEEIRKIVLENKKLFDVLFE
ncbi:MAG: hypothetical protein QXP77_00950 [Candidatus Aenigmatarchaeota archaeon]